MYLLVHYTNKYNKKNRVSVMLQTVRAADRIQGSNKRFFVSRPQTEHRWKLGRTRNHMVKNGCGARYKY